VTRPRALNEATAGDYRLVIYDAAVPPIDEFALYQVDRDGSAGGVAIPGPFDAVRYSRYKYGSTVAAGWFARALGQAFLDRYPRLAHQPRLLIASSPYRRVPTAANALAVRFATVLNAARAGRGLPSAPLVHIERMAASCGDYGTLSAEAGSRLMAVNALSFDRLRPHADGAHLVVVDDVKVTGAYPVPIRIRVHRHAAEARVTAGACDPDRDLPPVGNQNLAHRCSFPTRCAARTIRRPRRKNQDRDWSRSASAAGSSC
jgi:hypothetical protein